MTAAWDGYRERGKVPPRLEPPASTAVKALSGAVRARDQRRAEFAAIDVGQAVLDIELRYGLRSRSTSPGSSSRPASRSSTQRRTASAGVNGDVASLEWTRDRLAKRLRPVDFTRINRTLLTLREKVVDEDLDAASAHAASLRRIVAVTR